MRITQEGDYALRVVLYLFKTGIGERIEAKTISEHENVPQRFLLKLLRKLAIGGIIESYKGHGGGYVITKNPSEISVLNVIEAIEGPVAINKCLEDKTLCNAGRAETCEVHKALESVQKNLVSELGSITFSKLLD
ncbi:MAG TPA: Rrf2 family transcriptional regulator [Ruminiclostridium sp.]|nr:Rrf2 family transcriptional regulator [Ruminiclostridium sp.]